MAVDYLRSGDYEEILREEWDYLIDHAETNTPENPDRCGYGCPECRRYTLIRTMLLERFQQPPKQTTALASIATWR